MKAEIEEVELTTESRTLPRSPHMTFSAKALVLLLLVTSALLSIPGAPSAVAQSSPSVIRGEVKARTAETIQVQVAHRVLPVSVDIAIRDEEGHERRVDQVYVGMQVVLHLEKGRIVAMTLLAD